MPISESQTDLRITRELWLENAIEDFRPRFTEMGYPLADHYHVSVGFGYGAKRENSKLEGQCWSRLYSEDGIGHIFVSPEVSDTVHVLEILLHELIHCALDGPHGIEDGHRKRFAEIATRLGFLGPMTETPASPALYDEFICVAIELGPYPHGSLLVARDRSPIPVSVDGGRRHSGPRTQTNRHLKCTCPCCGYTVRTTVRWIETGLPRCPTGTEMALMN